ncbi:MAG: 16S rRNA (guanine(527)-N(7))-methyltransferase RsmG, partial [Flavobacteriaceae bacterium]|nr:16S rRNA (guanine(527)-N(7))-methyltransferase RsmG [Flavobacteriaceae bacterium]
SRAIDLKNVTTEHIRAEELQGQYHFIVSRAVTTMPKFVNWVCKLISTEQFNDLPNGILYLKGGELDEELSSFERVNMYELGHIFTEPFFQTKKLVHLVP